MPPIPDILQLVLAGVTIGAAVSDLHSRTIPNWLVVGGLALGFGVNSCLFQWNGLGRAAIGFALAAAVYLPLFALRAMGGGDVKLMAAVGSIAGARNWFVIFLLTAVMGGLAALVMLLFKGILRSTLRNVAYILNELMQLRAPHLSAPELSVSHPQAVTLPHGAVIAGGTLLFLALLRLGLLQQ
jgi:prepilin peptidase CpaA